ncbi:hypothetical protein F4802DRAFT_557015 [Xylaria palmicola]|nr:hypothetical protein F4802DRAFT_557015 [Xylaria palmicola]
MERAASPPPAMSSASVDWDVTTFHDAADGKPSASLSNSQSQPLSSSHSNLTSLPSPDSLPLYSSGSESSLLSRCSSITSFSSASSETDTDSKDDDCEPQILISILKKPRRVCDRRRDAGWASRQEAKDRPSNNSHIHNTNNNGASNQEDTKARSTGGSNSEVCAGDDEGEEDWQDWDDEESECDVIFERNVTFDDPLATDMVTGDPVAPSSRSRAEWESLVARKCLEWAGRCKDWKLEEEYDEEREAGDHDGREKKIEQGRHTDLGFEEPKEEKKGISGEYDADVEGYVIDVTETVVRLAAQEQR